MSNNKSVLTPTTTISTGLIYGSSIVSNSATPLFIHTIKGEMYIAEYSVPHNLSVSTYQIDDDAIKRKLVTDLVEKLFLSKSIEFTKSTVVNEDRIVYRARIYAVADTMVRIIRENVK